MQSIDLVIDQERIEYVKNNIKSYPDEERCNFLKTRPWWKNDNNILNTYLSSIIKGSYLVSVPGDEGNCTNLISLKNILIRIPKQNEIKMIEMEQSQCHDNCMSLLAIRKAKEQHSGYALSDDGLWRHHSWCIDDDGNIIETTKIRLIYITSTITDQKSVIDMFKDNPMFKILNNMMHNNQKNKQKKSGKRK